MTDRKRVLGRVRLSRDSDTSTSEASQRDSITAWAAMHGHEVIGWAVDLDVSGAVSAFSTPEFGRWLEQPSEWDIVVAYKLDRLGRGLFDLATLFRWCQTNGKDLACVKDSIDLTTANGRLLAAVMAAVAEAELENIRQRNQGSQSKIRELGRWHGGTVPYGYRADRSGAGWYLHPDPDRARIVAEVFRRAAAHDSIRGIATDLNDRGVPSPRGGRWSAPTLTRMLRSRWVLGQSEHEGRVVTDDDGMPLQRAEPLVSLAEHARAAAALDDQSRPKHQQHEQAMLLHVVYCLDCRLAGRGWAPLYLQVQYKRSRDKTYRYLRCSNRQGKTINPVCTAKPRPADRAEREISMLVLDEIGDVQRTERVYQPGDDRSTELDQVESAISVARRERDAGLYLGDDDGYLARVSGLVERRNRLADAPSVPAGYVVRPVAHSSEDACSAAGCPGTGCAGETFREAWERSGPDERRGVLLAAGVRALVGTETDARGIGGVLWVPEDVRQRVGHSTE